MVPAHVDSHSPLHSAAAWCGLGFCQHHNWWSVKGPLCPGRPWWRRPVMCVLCEDPGFPGGRVCSLLPTGQPAHTPLTAHGLSAGTQVQAGPGAQGPGAQGATTQPWVHAPCQLSQASGPPPLFPSSPHWRPLLPGFLKVHLLSHHKEISLSVSSGFSRC